MCYLPISFSRMSYAIPMPYIPDEKHPSASQHRQKATSVRPPERGGRARGSPPEEEEEDKHIDILLPQHSPARLLTSPRSGKGNQYFTAICAFFQDVHVILRKNVEECPKLNVDCGLDC
jgi:hypothetical protein